MSASEIAAYTVILIGSVAGAILFVIASDDRTPHDLGAPLAALSFLIPVNASVIALAITWPN